MKLPWPIGALELWLGLATLALGILAVLTTLGGMAGGYTGAVQCFMRLQLIMVVEHTERCPTVNINSQLPTHLWRTEGSNP